MENNVEENPVLAGIKRPSDAKRLNEKETDELCSEIRKTLINVVSKTGGHLASNLGTVELTVALHKSFDSPDDKIIWDVGHQAYAHKMLTGRYSKFSTLRREGGLSGFARPDESECDPFYEGHAGVAVSQAAGAAAANAVKGSKNYAVAVIGDGSLGNGTIYEALNHAGFSKNRLIVVLNDNKMSISKSVGAMARYLAVLRAKPEYYRFKAGIEKALRRIPVVGKVLSEKLFAIKTKLKNMIYSSSFFEDLGFRYIGPIDGHNVQGMCEAFDSAKMAASPALIHIYTVKGKGYDYAESEPEKFHAISKFDVDAGESLPAGESCSSRFGSLLCDFAARDGRICAITAAMAAGTGLKDFSKRFPERFFDVGIAEEHAVIFASGLASGGMLPVFAVYSTFLQRCADQLIHDVALQKRKIIIAVDRAGFVGEDGETHQGLYDVSIANAVPNTVIYSPHTYAELGRVFYNAFYREGEKLIIIRYPRGALPAAESEKPDETFCNVVGDVNAETAIVTYGRIYFNVLETAESLLKKGKPVKIIRLGKIKPLPEKAIDAVLDAKNVFFFEEGARSGGIGESFASKILEKGYRGKYCLTAVDDEFAPHASVESLMRKYFLDAPGALRVIEKGLEE